MTEDRMIDLLQQDICQILRMAMLIYCSNHAPRDWTFVFRQWAILTGLS